MKPNLFFFSLFISTSVCLAQEQQRDVVITRDENNNIKSAEFINADMNDIPESAGVFFKNYLNITQNDQFIRTHESKQGSLINEHYDQYYKGVKVDEGGYNFHYKNNILLYAHGDYKKIDHLDIDYNITTEKAMEIFANYKNIPVDSIYTYSSDTLIKEMESGLKKGFSLVYRITLFPKHINSDEIGYIDTETGEILLIESTFTYVTATFNTTRYSGIEYGETSYYGGSYHLYDDTRGADIFTRNLEGGTFYNDAVELSDNDNIWTTAEHSSEENDMALDVFWALQNIYDHLYTHGYNSFDNNGQGIYSYIHYGITPNDRDQAAWDPSYPALRFGNGYIKYRPVSSLDIVSHEFGHGISYYQIGWGSTGLQPAFKEGMSDIWAAIMGF